MAHERTLGYAPEREEEPSKEELQRRMEEARDSISSTVNDIKETVAHQVETVKDALDWREHFKRAPVAWSLGAAGVGFLAGYGVAAAIKGDSREDYSDVWSIPKAYAAQPILGEPSLGDFADSAVTPKNIHGNGGTEEGPGLLARFKETSTYDRLSKEAASIGDRLVEELSSTAQTVVLPALLTKLKNWIGLDLSGKQEQSKAKDQPRGAAGQSHRNAYEPILERPS
jgi:hypothetical protein